MLRRFCGPGACRFPDRFDDLPRELLGLASGTMAMNLLGSVAANSGLASVVRCSHSASMVVKRRRH